MGASRFNVGRSCFSDGGALFLSRGCTPYGGIGFDGVGVFGKNGRMGGAPPCPPLWETLGSYLHRRPFGNFAF